MAVGRNANEQKKINVGDRNGNGEIFRKDLENKEVNNFGNLRESGFPCRSYCHTPIRK